MPRALPCLRQSQGISRHLCRAQFALRHGERPYSSGTKRHASSFTFTSTSPPRYRARTASEEVTAGQLDDKDISSSEGLRQSTPQALSRNGASPDTEPRLGACPPLGSNLYGKWQSLFLDAERLAHESDINSTGGRDVRLVDQPENEHDMELWSCLLEFVHRRMGRDGVVMLWQAVFKRRNLYQLDGPLAQAFWDTILKSAVNDNNFLLEVIEYAEWMLETHHVRWPRLYSTVISHMVENHCSGRELAMWHTTLMPSFGPDEAEFVDLLEKFIAIPGHTQDRLRRLYKSSVYRKLYDILIPYLYTRGHAKLAMKWRLIFTEVNDVPVSLGARPFIRYLVAYFPETPLTDDELRVAGLLSNKPTDENPTALPPESAVNSQTLSYLINRVHGESFGIQEKPYNDKLGAKWFASSWVGLDFAIHLIYTMGVQDIGPLSLQSIALREGNAQGVLYRIEQLRQLKIKLPKTNYAAAIQQHAASGDNESLLELIHSDVHPDVFDDEVAQDELLAGCVRAGDWKTYRLVLGTRLAVLSGSGATASYRMLESCVRRSDSVMALQVLQEMAAHNLAMAPTISHVLSGFILQNLSRHIKPHKRRKHVDLQVSLCRQLAATRFPPAVEVWQTLLYHLGREKRLVDLERLSLHILRLFADHAGSDQPMWISHMADIPPILHSQRPFEKFQKLPRDLPLRHPKHPLNQIFDPKLQSAIVRWGFTNTPYSREAEDAAASVLNSTSPAAPDEDGRVPADFHFARGIKLLAMLRDRGMAENEKKVQKQATKWLIDLYRGEGRADYEWQGGNTYISLMRMRTRFSLAEAKKLCDEAWDRGEVVPSLFELDREIEATEREDRVRGLQARLNQMKERR